MNVRIVAEALRLLARGLEEDGQAPSVESAAPVQAAPPLRRKTAAEMEEAALRQLRKMGWMARD